MEELAGYRGKALEFLKKADASVGDVLEVQTDWGAVTGTLVPRYEYNDEAHVVLKLSNGYNVGVAVGHVKAARLKEKGEKPSFSPPPVPNSSKHLPRVAILGTGGTIASRVDYRTGAVHPAVSAEELYALIPELSEIANIEPKILMSIFSENMEPSQWSLLAESVSKAVSDGVAGVVITHGTDTMGYTAAALAFALAGVPVPVILVGAQRSSDRPSSDAFLNLVGGVWIAANAPFSGVYLAMHVNESDDEIALHVATRVRKDHTSARGAFDSIGIPYAAVWTRRGLEKVMDSLPKRVTAAGFKPKAAFDGGAALLKFYPAMPTTQVEALREAGVRALVIEGTGLGHVNARNVAALKEFVSHGGMAFMTSQCMNGRVDLNVYDTGRDLIAAGVIPLEDMLAETALAKAMWVLANTTTISDARSAMIRNIAGEMTSRRFPE
jgi:glutamyl-tRNA(Gln) amidotransferase subunit D